MKKMFVSLVAVIKDLIVYIFKKEDRSTDPAFLKHLHELVTEHDVSESEFMGFFCSDCDWMPGDPITGKELTATVTENIEENNYPDRNGNPTKTDPTYGRIDRDIQWYVEDMEPSSLGQRVAMENTLQDRRNKDG